ncbi:hypothetical protein C8R45DRAFT_1065814 [Mycena sanguinolenta]|nr:hypothetical protein C8R45DRAFT_1065814 [Mycena sanguinolenta]
MFGECRSFLLLILPWSFLPFIPLHTAAHPRSSFLSILHRRAVFETAVVTTPAPQSHPLSYASAAQQHFADQHQPASAICICLPLHSSATSSSHATPAFRLSPTLHIGCTPAHTDVRTLAKARRMLSGRMLALLASHRDANHPERVFASHLLGQHRWPMFAAMLFGIITGIMPRSVRRTRNFVSLFCEYLALCSRRLAQIVVLFFPRYVVRVASSPLTASPADGSHSIIHLVTVLLCCCAFLRLFPVLYYAACFNFVSEPDWVFRSFRSASVLLCGCRVLLL